MRKERYNICKRLIEEGRWEIDLEKGTVKGRYGSIGSPNTKGYLYLNVMANGKKCNFKVHEIIAVAGGLVPIDVTIDHINGDKLDNRFCNLQLLSLEDNTRKANLGNQLGSKNPKAKLTEKQVAEIKMMLIDGRLTQVCIAWLYGVNKVTISDIKKCKTWGHVKIEDYI